MALLQLLLLVVNDAHELSERLHQCLTGDKARQGETGLGEYRWQGRSEVCAVHKGPPFNRGRLLLKKMDSVVKEMA